MPTYQYRCSDCGYTEELVIPLADPHPSDLLCPTCNGRAKRRFSFGFQSFDIEIHSPNVGKHGSVRSYNTARDRLSAIHEERIGRPVTLESFDARDPDADPTKKLR